MLFSITQDFEDIEYHAPVEAFRAASHSVPGEKQAGNIIYSQQRKSSVSIDLGIDDISVQDFDALMIPGGHSPYHLKKDQRFIDFLRSLQTLKNLFYCVVIVRIYSSMHRLLLVDSLTSIHETIKELKRCWGCHF